MMSQQTDHGVTPNAPRGWRGALANVGIPILLVVLAIGLATALIESPPQVPKSELEMLAPVVGIAELRPHDVEVFVDAFGTVVPSREARVSPQVSGRIVQLNSKLEPGGLIKAGELLFEIDPADYDIALGQSRADLDVAKHEPKRILARVEMLEGRRKQLDVEIANLQWNAERLGRLAERNSAAQSEAREAMTRLESQKAARESLEAEIIEQQRMVESAKAQVRVVERRVESAQLALDRTKVVAPFDLVVLSEIVEKGQLVGAQSPVATVAATDEFWVEAAISVARLGEIRFKVDHPENPSQVAVELSTGDATITRNGFALRPLGSLDPLGRMARVLVSIEDPMGLAVDATDAGRQDVLLGSYVRLQIASGTMHDVVSIPRKALRENDRVWVRDIEGHLAIRPVTIVWRRRDDVLVRDAFEEGDRLVTTHLASVVPGIPLRIRDESDGPAMATSTDGESAGQNGAVSGTP